MNPDEQAQQVRGLHQRVQQLAAELSQARQEAARARRKVELLRRVPQALANRLDPALLEQIIEAEGEQAAQQEAQDFPTYFQELQQRAQTRTTCSD